MLVLLVLIMRAQVALPGFSKACMVMNPPHGGGLIIGVRNSLSILIFSDGKRRSHRVLFSRSC